MKIKGNDVSIETYAVLNEGQTVSRLEPVIKIRMKTSPDPFQGGECLTE